MHLTRRSLLAASGVVAAGSILRPPAPAAAVARDYWPTRRWRTAAPEEHGIDPGLLAQADQTARDWMPDVTGVVVIRNGYIVFEDYYGDRYGRDDPLKIRSVTKSF